MSYQKHYAPVDKQSTNPENDTQLHTITSFVSPKNKSYQQKPWELNNEHEVSSTQVDSSVRDKSLLPHNTAFNSYQPFIHQISSRSSSSLDGFRTITGSNDNGYYGSYDPFQMFTYNYQNRNRRLYNVLVGIILFILWWIIFNNHHRKNTAKPYIQNPSYNQNNNDLSVNGTKKYKANAKNFDTNSGLSFRNTTITYIPKVSSQRLNIFCPTDSCNDPNITSPLPRLSYLLAYPHSGTTYFMDFIHDKMKVNTATNYVYNAFNESFTIFSSASNSDSLGGFKAAPYWSLNPEDTHCNIPKSYILTETHCTGYCNYPCSPSEFLQTPYTFEEGCRTIVAYTDNPEKNNTNTWKEYIYSDNKYYNNTAAPVVSRIVHLVRDPFSNIVARYRNARLVHTQQRDTSWLKKHPNNKNGFRRWCQEMDVQDILIQEDEDEGTRLKRERDKEIVHMINDNIDVPCHDEFFKYIQWHNNAVTMEWMHGYPTYILYYEDLKSIKVRLDVVHEIASFLKWNMSLQDIELSSDFVPTFHNYTTWYTNIEIRNINYFLYKWAYPQTLEFIQRYL